MSPKLTADIQISMTPTRARDFLEALLDDKKRGELIADPAGFLHGYGITIAPGAIPDPVELPTVGELEVFYSLTGALPRIKYFSSYRELSIGRPEIKPMTTCFVWSNVFIAVSARIPKRKPKA
jgi:hypothetical protein